MDTVGEFAPWGAWPESGQDEACWEGQSLVSGRRDEFADSIRCYSRAGEGMREEANAGL
jgi:hypothetical protein